MNLELFIPGIPKNSNAKSQWARFAKAANNKQFRTLSAQIARDNLPANWKTADHTTITARHIYTVRRRRDPLGLAERLKGIMDGLVDAGVLPDDDEEHLTIVLARSRRGESPGIHLTIEQESTSADRETQGADRHR